MAVNSFYWQLTDQHGGVGRWYEEDDAGITTVTRETRATSYEGLVVGEIDRVKSSYQVHVN